SEIFIKLQAPTHLPDGQMAGLKHDANEIHVWVSDRLPDDQVHRAIGAIVSQAVAKAQKGGTLNANEKKHAAAAGQLDALLGHLETVKKENDKPLETLPEGDTRKRIDAATRNAKRESSERIAAEIELLLAKHD